MISRDEARHTVEADDRFVILPEHPWWGTSNWANGKPVAEGFEYTSDNNERSEPSDRELQDLVSPLLRDSWAADCRLGFRPRAKPAWDKRRLVRRLGRSDFKQISPA